MSAAFAGIASLSTVVGMIPEAIAVGIDIKPADFSNTIDLKSRGLTPVAILSSQAFDARSVRPETVRVAGAAARLLGKGWPMFSFQDVNGDCRRDMVLYFETQTFELTSSDTEAVLLGETAAGIPIVGRDSIRLGYPNRFGRSGLFELLRRLHSGCR